MSISRPCLLFAVMTTSLLAQQDAPAKDLLNSALMQRAIDGIVAGSGAKPHLGWIRLGLRDKPQGQIESGGAATHDLMISLQQAKSISPCSVPLLNAQIPSGVEFTMQQFHPSKDKMDSMPVIVPAASCTDPR